MDQVMIALGSRKSLPVIPPCQGVASLAIAGAVCLGFALSPSPARAQYSPQDGYTENGGYRVHAELTPYLWLPASKGTASIGNGREVSFSSGPPTIADLAHSLHGAVVAFGLIRYGPWSAETDFQWIDAFHKTTIQPNLLGPFLTQKDSVTLVRVAPGFGYQVYSGSLAGIPITVDDRVGFSYLTWSLSAKIEQTPFSGVDASHDFLQPWAGFRVDFYPGKNWRLELGANAEGFGVDGGVCGWGASALVYYSINSWLDAAGGFRALSSRGRGNGRDPFRRAIDITLYGPILGLGVRF